MKRNRSPPLSAVQVLGAVGQALHEGRAEDVKGAASALLVTPGEGGHGARSIDLRAQLGLPRPIVPSELDHALLGQSGFRAMLSWYLATVEHQRHQYTLSAQHASQARALLEAKESLPLDRSRSNSLPSRELLRAVVSVSEVVSAFHASSHDDDLSAVRKLPKRLHATLAELEGNFLLGRH